MLSLVPCSRCPNEVEEFFLKLFGKIKKNEDNSGGSECV